MTEHIAKIIYSLSPLNTSELESPPNTYNAIPT